VVSTENEGEENESVSAYEGAISEMHAKRDLHATVEQAMQDLCDNGTHAGWDWEDIEPHLNKIRDALGMPYPVNPWGNGK